MTYVIPAIYGAGGAVADLAGASGWNWGSVPDWIVAGTAVVAALYGGLQLAHLRKNQQDSADDRRQNLKIQQGLQLMEIDCQYEGVLQPSRKALLALRRRVEKVVPEGIEGRRGKIAEQVSEHLRDLRVRSADSTSWNPFSKKPDPVDEYFLLTQLPNYIETMGVLVNERLVDDVVLVRLYDGMIARVIGDVLPHIHWRRIVDDNPDYLIFAERLYQKAVVHMGRERLEERTLASAAADSPN